MRISLSAPLALAALLALGACGPVNRGLGSVNQPVVQRTDYVYDIGSGGSFGPDDTQRLAAWFDAIQLRYGDRVSIDDRYGAPATREAVATLLARYGIFLADTAPVTAGSNDLAGSRVIVSRSTASVPNCPNWHRTAQPEFSASTTSNFGCAVNSNLAAMVASPADLVQGQPGMATDAMTINRAIKTYREAQPTGKGELKKESSGSGGAN